ncbi:hypothetical protein TL18_04210 [Methanobrevibacter sp. YE315]|uniref:DUF308 domain-containing protein n=1 Tax=Methanobrevibacter sp. YE315 TaxID=1609968 RepID=UPI000764DB3E|nr:DUF308 domain-containing protein [Methanobrevibacter sp. YE315]AMD17295.1 hypothetical protein TL18_04210 [Methanobrevibacter sp. YE315]
MDYEKSAGIFFLVLGLIFILFPMFSTELVSIIVGLSLVFFGISAAFMGYTLKDEQREVAIAIIIIGIISMIIGLLFIFYINAIAFLVAFEFYIVGFIMILFGIVGLISKVNRISNFTSILVLLMGIVAIALGVFAANNPLYLAIIIGVVLIIEGISYLLSD